MYRFANLSQEAQKGLSCISIGKPGSEVPLKGLRATFPLTATVCVFLRLRKVFMMIELATKVPPRSDSEKHNWIASPRCPPCLPTQFSTKQEDGNPNMDSGLLALTSAAQLVAEMAVNVL